MQGPKARLDQIFPARKVNAVVLPSPKLNGPPHAKRKQNPAEVSPQKKGTLESFIVKSKSTDNHPIGQAWSGYEDKQAGINRYIRQSTWPKPSTERWLQGCGSSASKFVPKRLLEPDISRNDFCTANNSKPIFETGEGHHIGPCLTESKSSPDLLQASRKLTRETTERSNSQGQLTQFADDHLSRCVSGVIKDLPPCNPPGTGGVDNSKKAMRVVDDDDDCPRVSKKQRHSDGLELDVISCTQHFLPIRLSGNDVGTFGDKFGSVKEERSVGLLKSFKEQSIERGLSGLPSIFSSKEFAQLELTPGGGVDPRGGSDLELTCDVPHVDDEGIHSGSDSPKLSKGLVSCSNISGALENKIKSSVSGDIFEKEAFQIVSFEGFPPLPPPFKTPEEQVSRHKWGSGRKTPKSRSRLRSKSGEGGFGSTPYSRNAKKSDRRSFSSGKSGGWQYHNSLFSPGDAFWDEAFEAADVLLVSKLNGAAQKQSSRGKSILSSAERTTRAVDGAIQNQVEQVPGIQGILEVVGANVGRFQDSSVEKGPADVEVENLEGITNFDRIPNTRFDELDISPLPVRRFSFTCQSSPPNKNVIKLTTEEVSKACPTAIQEPLGPVRLESFDGKDNCSGGETIKANVHVIEASKEICETVVGTDLQLQVVAHVEHDATSKLHEPVLAVPSKSADSLSAGQMRAYAHLSAGDHQERFERKVIGAVVPLVAKQEHAFISRSPKNISLDLADWIPSEACAMYAKKGLKRLYPWQVECLQVDGVLDGRSLVYCASTSAGKSLVAEVLMLRRILSTGKKALLVLPYVALCSEKADHLDAILEPLGKRVRGFYGSQGGSSLTKDTSVAVCTIEKANSLVNKLLEEGRLSELAILVIDELHMVGDTDRGYLLELLLTKLRFAAGGGECNSPGYSSKENRGSSSSRNTELQIVGMSATMPNVSDVATWLQAALYQTVFRPVPLEEFIKVGHTIYNKKMEFVRSIKKNADLSGKDPDHLVELCHEGEERDIVEACFKSGVVRVLVATSTLAAGVNLPARRVIFRQPKIGRDFLDATRYRQMAGRAGRAGIDTKGESILICKPEEVKRMEEMIRQECKALCSCLADDKNGMIRALLEVVAGGVVQTAADVQRYVRCTLLNATQPFEEVVKAAQESLRWLCHKQLVEWDRTSRLYTTTPLGRAAFSSSLSPEESLVVYEDLAKAREGFVLASDLHLLYEVTPTYVDIEPDWGVYYSRFMELSHTDQAVGNRVGVVEPFLMRMAHGVPLLQQGGNGRPRGGKISKAKISPPFQKHKWNSSGAAPLPVEQMLRVCKRFYVSLMLSKLVQEVPLMEICESFKVPRGTVQALQDSAGRFAGMVGAFCERLGWSDMEGLFSKFQKRVSFGVKSEIVDLTEIPFVKAARARALFKAGLRSVHAIAEASLPEIIKALYGNISWAGPGENRAQQWMQLGVARNIKNGARRLALDRAEEARAAAFSAYEALGVQVPAMLALPMVGTLGNEEEALVNPDISFHSTMKALTVDGDPEVKDVPISSEVKGGLATDINTSAKSLVYVQNAQSIPGSPKKDILEKESDLLLQKLESIPSFRVQNSKDPISTPDELLLEEATEKVDSDLGIQPVGKACEGLQMSSFKDGGPAKGALFNGSLIAQQVYVVDDTMDDLLRVPSRGPRDVDKLVGGFDEFLRRWQGVDEFAFDFYFRTPRKGLPDPFEVMGVAICWKDSPVYYVNLSIVHKSFQHATNPNCGNKEVIIREVNSSLIESQTRWRHVGTMLSKTGVRKISWDLKIQLQVLNNPGLHVPSARQTTEHERGVPDVKAREGEVVALPSIRVQMPCIDTRVAAWLLWPDEESTRLLSLEQEVKKRLPGEIAAAAGRAGRWANQMGCVAHNGCCRRVAQIWVLHCAFWKLLVAEGLHEALLQLEMPLVRVLADMETWSLGLDMRVCRKAQSHLHCKLRELEAQGEKLAGMSFSLSAPAEVAHVLYRHLKLPVPPGCKGKHHPSTDKQALEFLRNHHPIADIIKEHRSLSKLLQSTLGSIIAWAKSPEPLFSSQERSSRGEIFSIAGHWLQTSTATGRLSMEDPNLQCVEHAVSFTIEGGRSLDGDQEKANNVVEVNARQAFVPSQEGWILLSADYSQIELRLMAHFSGDPSLVSLLSHPTGDLFRVLAAQWTGLPMCEVSDKQRERTKRLVYGILYGMGVNTLAEHLECPVAEAQVMLERFKGTFPLVTTWLSHAVDSCRQKGYITTLSGRKRYLDKINTGKWGEQAKAERQAVNSICQGSAADLIKLAMIKVHDAISSSHQGSCRLLLQIHDELLLEVDKRVLKHVAQILRSSMEGAITLRVPLRTKLQVGTSWGSLQLYTED
ncbi:helicase and polymerase-containing protein TEBICHI isoform X3 [Physcomitrium patens]|uniref:helicase and polymerase-containing protein TEBICHI isoform X3 n=1 Tax=Physcomitrium patens TaxID=3218 RepID=UPI003CCD012C